MLCSGHNSARLSVSGRSVLGALAALLLATSLLFASQGADEHAADSKKPVAATGGTKHGQEIFETKCMICHNQKPGASTTDGPPNLYEAFKNKTVTVPQAEEIITHGKGQMPAFGTMLSKSDMVSVIAYIKSVK
jgi:mono/diheme cytochrome c family protein